MALVTLPYPNMDFIPLDILTASELDQLVANIDAINNATIQTANIANNAITTAKIADGALSTAKYADGSISTAKVANGAITGVKLGSDVTSYSSTTLFYNNGSINTGNVTLSSAYTNFDELEIVFAGSGATKGERIMRFPTSNTNITLVHSHAGASQTAWIDFVQYTLSGTTMTRGNAYQKTISTSISNATTTVGVVKVIGIKYN